MVSQFNLGRPVIAITGSAGKSTTKEMLASILQTKWPILKSVDNWNFLNHTLKYKSQIRPFHKAIVLEYGMSNAGNIRRHCQIIKPNMGIITNVGSAHIGNFGNDIRKLAAAKSELIENMVQTGTFVMNADDKNSRLLKTNRFKGKILTVGIDSKADYKAKNVNYITGGMSFQVDLSGQTNRYSIPIYGKHEVYNALCAIAIAHTLGFGSDQIRSGLATYRKMHSRLIVHPLPNQIKLIDDSFSANPQATKAALDVLSSIGKNNNIAILGSMLSLGAYSNKGHADVGAYLAKCKIHYLLTFGHLAKPIGTAAIKNGFPKSHVWHFTDRTKLHRTAIALMKPGTTILIKGSHDVAMRETVMYLLQHLRKHR